MTSYPCFNETVGPENATVATTGGGAARQKEESAEAVVQWIIIDIAVPFMCCLGILGNLLSLVVLATERMHRTLTKMEISAHIGLIALTVSDLLFCVLVLTVTQVPRKEYYEEGDALIYIALLTDGLITIFIITSTWLIVVMAAERYIAVCIPLRARKLISLRRTRIVTFLVFFLCSMATVPIFLERSIEEVVCHTDGRLVYQVQPRSVQSVKLRRILWAVFFDFIPCIALIYFNTCLIVQIRKAKKLRDNLTHRHSTTSASASRQKTKPTVLPTVSIYNNKRNKSTDRNETSLTLPGGDQVAKSSQALLQRPENGCPKRQSPPNSSTSSADGNYNNKVTLNKFTQDTTDHPWHWANGHELGADQALCPKEPPRTSWAASDASPRLLQPSRGNETRRSEASALKHGDRDPIIRRGIKTSTVKKRPSDGALNSVTATLVAVIILFLILVSPCEILKFSLTYTVTENSRIVTCITNFMQVTNFSLNFLLYCAVNKSFRYTLKRLAFSCWNSIKSRC